jgi:hypothetical protein
MSCDAYDSRMTCPYCGNPDCQADYVDIGIGLQQMSPFYCEGCGACQIGGYDNPAELTEDEKRTHWYAPGRSYLTSAPTLDGVPLKHDEAMDLYRRGLLDKKEG